MKVYLDCPHAEYTDGMRIFCKKAREPCAHVYFKQCKGWWALTPPAARCPLRRDQIGQESTPIARRADGV